MVLINLTDAWFVTGLGAGPLGMKPIILRQAQDKTERQAAALMVRRPEGPSRTMARRRRKYGGEGGIRFGVIIV
jgi:hypothetical protein